MKKKKVNLSLKKMTVAHLNDNLKRAINGGSVGCDILGNGTKTSKQDAMICGSKVDGAC